MVCQQEIELGGFGIYASLFNNVDIILLANRISTLNSYQLLNLVNHV